LFWLSLIVLFTDLKSPPKKKPAGMNSSAYETDDVAKNFASMSPFKEIPQEEQSVFRAGQSSVICRNRSAGSIRAEQLI